MAMQVSFCKKPDAPTLKVVRSDDFSPAPADVTETGVIR